jgi:biofilm PGA synthesis N-glycosyltransferase PgaC
MINMVLILFWTALIFVIYTYLIYPLAIILLSLLAKNSKHIDDNGLSLPSLTMIIVVRNEEKRVLEKLDNCHSLDYPDQLLEICFVSDGSTDKTNELLSPHGDITFIQETEHRGKPAQINNAISQTDGELVVFSDVRQKYREDALLKLARNFNDPNTGAVSGELHLDQSGTSTSKNIGLYWKYEKMIRKAEARIDSTLGVSGAIYAIRRELFEPIPEDTILDDIEIPLAILRKGYRVTFDPDAAAYDISFSEISREWNRKVRTLAGNFQLFSRNHWLFNPRKNRIFVQAVSHKFFRLLVPYALLIILFTSAILSGIGYKIFFSAQLIAYFLGLTTFVFKGFRSIRLINFISVFLSLNCAAVAALYKYSFKKTDARWKK